MENNFLWIKSVIESCKNSFQLACCNVLCARFDEMYGDHGHGQQLLQAIIDQEQKWAINA
jgi:hypothetical protein